MKKGKGFKKIIIFLILIGVGGYVGWYSLSPDSPQNKPTEEVIQYEEYVQTELRDRVLEQTSIEGYDFELNTTDETLNSVTKDGLTEYLSPSKGAIKEYEIETLGQSHGLISIYLYNHPKYIKTAIKDYEKQFTSPDIFHRVKKDGELLYQYDGNTIHIVVGNTLYRWRPDWSATTPEVYYQQFQKAKQLMQWEYDFSEFEQHLKTLSE